MSKQEIKDYLSQMPRTERYQVLTEAEQDAYIFEATELIASHFDDEVTVSPRAYALQVLYMLNDEQEWFDQLKAAGVKRYNVKGASVEFESGGHSGISPQVAELIALANPGMIKSYGAQVGRLI